MYISMNIENVYFGTNWVLCWQTLTDVENELRYFLGNRYYREKQISSFENFVCEYNFRWWVIVLPKAEKVKQNHNKSRKNPLHHIEMNYKIQ